MASEPDGVSPNSLRSLPGELICMIKDQLDGRDLLSAILADSSHFLPLTDEEADRAFRNVTTSTNDLGGFLALLEDKSAGPQIRRKMESWTITGSQEADMAQVAESMARLKHYLTEGNTKRTTVAAGSNAALWPNLTTLTIGDPEDLLASESSQRSGEKEGGTKDETDEERLASLRKETGAILHSLIQSTAPHCTISYFPSAGQTGLPPPSRHATTPTNDPSIHKINTYLLQGSSLGDIPIELGRASTMTHDGIPDARTILNVFMTGNDPRNLQDDPLMQQLCKKVRDPSVRKQLQQNGLYLHMNVQGTSRYHGQRFDTHAERIKSEPSLIDGLVDIFSDMWPHKRELIKALGWAAGASPYWLSSTHKWLSKHVTDPLSTRLSSWHDTKQRERTMAETYREPWAIQRSLERTAKLTADFLASWSYSQREIPSSWLTGYARSPTILKDLERALQPTEQEKWLGKAIPYAVTAEMVHNRSQIQLQADDPDLFDRFINKVKPT